MQIMAHVSGGNFWIIIYIKVKDYFPSTFQLVS